MDGVAVLTQRHQDQEGRDQKGHLATRPLDGRNELARRETDQHGQ